MSVPFNSDAWSVTTIDNACFYHQRVDVSNVPRGGTIVVTAVYARYANRANVRYHLLGRLLGEDLGVLDAKHVSYANVRRFGAGKYLVSMRFELSLISRYVDLIYHGDDVAGVRCLVVNEASEE
ncbi:hypothetical protein CRV025 [Nile crocodilepox virus]|uniref:Uncharacterized protein n=1 Tax=Nile crocodilepox virus (isolate Crocodylus niloticus/Zimbabwe/Ume/2001) TaxID=1289473 RepID=Q070M6_CPRVZ|nr:hypothetical protein CRV025 [Nile crocodilepox virus]ABJ08916.1 hypothetical protein CRV025 [Nile crocodilepox virus]